MNEGKKWLPYLSREITENQWTAKESRNEPEINVYFKFVCNQNGCFFVSKIKNKQIFLKPVFIKLKTSMDNLSIHSHF